MENDEGKKQSPSRGGHESEENVARVLEGSLFLGTRGD